jgi:hypothetical protein
MAPGMHGPGPVSYGPGAPPPFVMPAWARTISPLVWAGIAVAVVVFFVGLGTYSSNASVADSCTVSSYGRWSVVEDSPTCDAALGDQEFGRNLMIVGAAAAIGLPARAATRRRPGTPPQGHRPGGTP